MALAADTNVESLRDLFDYQEFHEPIGNPDMEINILHEQGRVADGVQGHGDESDEEDYSDLEGVLRQVSCVRGTDSE